MAILEVLKYPDPRLSRIAQPVENINGDIVRLVNDLLETMYAAPGVGLAANQVGAFHRIIVLDVDHENPQKNVYKLINPTIVRSEGEILGRRLLERRGFYRRGASGRPGRGYGSHENEKEIKIEAEGLLAVALQHEIDHLDGKLFIDRISRLKRDLYTRKRKKMLRTGATPSESRHVMI